MGRMAIILQMGDKAVHATFSVHAVFVADGGNVGLPFSYVTEWVQTPSPLSTYTRCRHTLVCVVVWCRRWSRHRHFFVEGVEARRVVECSTCALLSSRTVHNYSILLQNSDGDVFGPPCNLHDSSNICGICHICWRFDGRKDRRDHKS